MSDQSEREFGLTSKERQSIFLELASRDGGVTAQEVYENATQFVRTLLLQRKSIVEIFFRNDAAILQQLADRASFACE